MKNIFLLFLSVVCSFSLFATHHHHSDENEVRYITGGMELDHQHQQLLREGNLWKNFRESYPNWFVIFNERNQMPHRAFGAPIPIPQIDLGLSVIDPIELYNSCI